MNAAFNGKAEDGSTLHSSLLLWEDATWQCLSYGKAWACHFCLAFLQQLTVPDRGIEMLLLWALTDFTPCLPFFFPYYTLFLPVPFVFLLLLHGGSPSPVLAFVSLHCLPSVATLDHSTPVFWLPSVFCAESHSDSCHLLSPYTLGQFLRDTELTAFL